MPRVNSLRVVLFSVLIVSGCSKPLVKEKIEVGRVPADWVRVSSAEPVTSVMIPGTWKQESVVVPQAARENTSVESLLRLAAPKSGSERYVATVLVSRNAIHIPTQIRNVDLDGFTRGAMNASPGAALVKSGVVDLPSGEAIALELNQMLSVGGHMVPYHQYLYDVIQGSWSYQIIISSPAGDNTAADIQKTVAASFKVG